MTPGILGLVGLYRRVTKAGRTVWVDGEAHLVPGVNTYRTCPEDVPVTHTALFMFIWGGRRVCVYVCVRARACVCEGGGVGGGDLRVT
jgi:hypothetical protein